MDDDNRRRIFLASHERFVWIIKVEFGSEHQYCNGFSVADNMILTHAILLCNPRKITKITARRLDQNNDFQLVFVANIAKNWGLAMLQFAKPREYINPPVTLAQDGSLQPLDEVIFIGSPDHLTKTCMGGAVSFPCINNPVMPESNTRNSSSGTREFICESLYETPAYRTFGDIYNSGTMENFYAKENAYDFLGLLETTVPIIQIGANFGCGSSTFGSPIFKPSGEIVGMYCGMASFQSFAIHSSILKEFVKDKNIGSTSKTNWKKSKHH